MYNFQPNSLQFTVAIDITGRDTKIPVTVNISDYNSRSNDSVQRQHYQLSKVQDIKVFISPNDDFTTANWDSINYEDLSIFYKGKLKYRPQALAESIFIKKTASTITMDAPLPTDFSIEQETLNTLVLPTNL